MPHLFVQFLDIVAIHLFEPEQTTTRVGAMWSSAVHAVGRMWALHNVLRSGGDGWVRVREPPCTAWRQPPVFFSPVRSAALHTEIPWSTTGCVSVSPLATFATEWGGVHGGSLVEFTDNSIYHDGPALKNPEIDSGGSIPYLEVDRHSGRGSRCVSESRSRLPMDVLSVRGSFDSISDVICSVYTQAVSVRVSRNPYHLDVQVGRGGVNLRSRTILGLRNEVKVEASN